MRLSLDRTITILIFVAVFAMAVRVPVDTDMYWHLAAGRAIAETGRVPTTDPFSSTMRGQPWIDVYWLAQWSMYGVYSLAGMNGLAILVAVLVAVAFIFVWKQMAGGALLRAFVLVLAAAASGVIWSPRPQMATFVLVAGLSYILYLYKWRQVDRLWIVPILFAVWANTHGGFVAGFLLLGAMIIGETLHILTRASDTAVIGWPRLRKLMVITLLSGAALLINPHTINVLRLPFETVNIGVLQNFIAEWASPDFHEVFQQPMLWLLLLTLIAIGQSGRRLDWTDATSLILFAYLSFVARRNIGLLAIVCAPILARHAAAWLERSRWGHRRLSPGISIVNGAIVIAILLAASVKVVVPLLPSVQTEAEARIMPAAAVEWIKTHRPSGLMFNSYNWGGYFLWRLGPDYPVFVDGRTDVYGDTLLGEYLHIIQAAPGFEMKLADRGVGFVVVDRNSLLARALARSSDWTLAHSDEQAVIYTRP